LIKIVLILSALAFLNPLYGANQEQINGAIKTLTTTASGIRRAPKDYFEVSGDSVMHAKSWDTTFANVLGYARTDIAYREWDDGSREIFSEFLKTKIPQGMTQLLVWDSGADGSADWTYSTTLGLNGGYEPMKRTYIEGRAQEFAREHGTGPSQASRDKYDAAIRLLGK